MTSAESEVWARRLRFGGPAAILCGLLVTGAVRNRMDWIAAAVAVALSVGGFGTAIRAHRLPGVAGHAARVTDDPWMLRIDTAFGTNFDSMVYLPGGRYPARAWGGAVVPIGRWAYVWE